MKVEKCKFITINNIYKESNLAFKHSADIPALNTINIGEAYDGIIGKTLFRDSNNNSVFLNVIKKKLRGREENYLIQNDKNEILGEIVLEIRKYTNYDKLEYLSDPSHVFISDLKNYSKPETPCHKNYEYHKDIGTRLMQIALKRSYEAMCNGNLKLIAKNEAKEWYKNIIGMTEEFPENTDSRYSYNIHNPNSLILPDESKEYLLNLHGGL